MTLAHIPYARQVERRVPIKTIPGVARRLGPELAAMNISSAFVIFDDQLQDTLLDTITTSLHEAGIQFSSTAVHADEEKKALSTLVTLTDSFAAARFGATTAVVAVGGGLIGNMAGLMASLLYRGVPLVHVPTTLLAQLDSAVDVKQSVNCGTQKNALGVLYPPSLVLSDPEMLSSLERRDRISGLGEAIKHGFAQDTEFARFVSEGNVESLSFLQEVTAKTVALKQKYWESASGLWADGDTEVRLTHLGHAVGKILEMNPTGVLTHGEAISHGMLVEARIARQHGYLSADELTYMERLLRATGLLDTSWSPDIPAIVDELRTRSQLKVALLEQLGAGRVVSRHVAADQVIRALRTYLEEREPAETEQAGGSRHA